MKLTDEQREIIESDAKRILIPAAAGAAKTTTLVEYAKARPDEAFLYVAYNNAIVKAAQARFPGNVVCKTAHGMAWQVMAKRFGHKLGDMKAPEMAARYKWPLRSCWAASKTLTNFLNSADLVMSEDHIPKDESKLPSDTLSLARAMWKRMIDPDDEMPISHNGYLKLFQLERGQDSMERNVLFDEAQDSNPVTTAMVASQNKGLVIVGDEFQSINAWRGAINAMDLFEVDKVYRLTRSFRYGDDVALMATKLLQDWRGNDFRIRGLDKQTKFEVDRSQPHAAIFRTNVGMYAYGISAMNMGARYGFIGGVDDRKLDFVRDVYQLFAGDRSRVRNHAIKAFWNYQDFRDYAKQMGDPEDSLSVRLVDQYKHDVPRLLNELVKRAVPVDPAKPEEVVALVTAHRSKGLEFNRVVLHDDFSDLEVSENDIGQMVGPDPQEVNLHYVAMTRAREAMSISPQLRRALSNPPPAEYTEELRRARPTFGVSAPRTHERQERAEEDQRWSWLAQVLDPESAEGAEGAEGAERSPSQSTKAAARGQGEDGKSWSQMDDEEKEAEFARRQIPLFSEMPRPKLAIDV